MIQFSGYPPGITEYWNFGDQSYSDYNGNAVITGTYVPAACSATKFTVNTQGQFYDSAGQIAVQLYEYSGMTLSYGFASNGDPDSSNTGTATLNAMTGFDCTMTNTNLSCSVSPTAYSVPAGSYLTMKIVISGDADPSGSNEDNATGQPYYLFANLTCQ